MTTTTLPSSSTTTHSNNNNKMSSAWTPNTSLQLTQGPLYYDILDHFYDHAESVRFEILHHQDEWMLQPARTTGEVQAQCGVPATRTRGDEATFLSYQTPDFQRKHPFLTDLLGILERTVRRAFITSCALHLAAQSSVQLARYPGHEGAGYPKHRDVSESSTSTELYRLVTAVYYLNNDRLCGGHLRLFPQNNNHQDYYDAAPYLNRCIVFRSDKVWHQVMPNTSDHDRWALTMWFYGKAVTDPPTTRILSIPPRSMPPPLSLPSHPDTTSTIFVSMVAYRDSETNPTLQALFQTAYAPDRIQVGLVWQCEPDDTPLPPLPSSKVLVATLNHAYGPCYARKLAQCLYHDQDYCLQIDSHMRFRPNWDVYLIQQLEQLSQANKKVLLTTYPVGYTLEQPVPNETRPTLLVPFRWDPNGLLRQKARLLKAIPPHPLPTSLYAAGFNFGHGTSITDCPYPGWRHVFWGEEVVRALQFFQNHYQLYGPPETVVYHLWSRRHRPVHTSSSSNQDPNPAVLEYIQQHATRDFWDAVGVDDVRKCLKQDLLTNDFVQDDIGNDDWQDRLVTLDPKAQALIQSFLSQLSTS